MLVKAIAQGQSWRRSRSGSQGRALRWL